MRIVFAIISVGLLVAAASARLLDEEGKAGYQGKANRKVSIKVQSTKLVVDNLPLITTPTQLAACQEQLTALFQKYGEVHGTFIPLDPETGRSLGFGYVTSESSTAMDAATALNNTDFMGKTIRVN